MEVSRSVTRRTVIERSRRQHHLDGRAHVSQSLRGSGAAIFASKSTQNRAVFAKKPAQNRRGLRAKRAPRADEHCQEVHRDRRNTFHVVVQVLRPMRACRARKLRRNSPKIARFSPKIARIFRCATHRSVTRSTLIDAGGRQHPLDVRAHLFQSLRRRGAAVSRPDQRKIRPF